MAEKGTAHKNDPVEAGFLDLCDSGNLPKMSRSGGSEGGLMGAGFRPEAETTATRHEPKSGERRPINSISAREIVLLLRRLPRKQDSAARSCALPAAEAALAAKGALTLLYCEYTKPEEERAPYPRMLAFSMAKSISGQRVGNGQMGARSPGDQSEGRSIQKSRRWRMRFRAFGKIHVLSQKEGCINPSNDTPGDRRVATQPTKYCRTLQEK